MLHLLKLRSYVVLLWCGPVAMQRLERSQFGCHSHQVSSRQSGACGQQENQSDDRDHPSNLHIVER